MITMLNVPTDSGSNRPDQFKVSVIIAHYNAGTKIFKNLEQLANQTMDADDFEVIIVDDKSPDGIENLEKFENKIKNLSVLIEPENHGYPSIPRNHGIDSARGTFIMIIDQDDYISNDALEKMVELASDKSDVVLPKYEEGTNFKGTQAPFKKGTILDATVYDNIISPLAPHKMFRRNFLNKNNIRFFSHDYIMVAEDQVFVARVYAQAERISILADKSYYFWTQQDEHLGGSSRYVINEPWKGINILKEVLRAFSSSQQLTEPEKNFAITTYVGRFIAGQGGGIIKLAGNMKSIEKRDEFIQGIASLIRKYVSPQNIFSIRETAMYLVLGLYHGLNYDQLKELQHNILYSTVSEIDSHEIEACREIEISGEIYKLPINFLNQEKIKLVGMKYDINADCLISINVLNDLLPDKPFKARMSIEQRHGSFKKYLDVDNNFSGINRQFCLHFESISEIFNQDNKEKVFDFYVYITRGNQVTKYRIGRERNESLIHLGKIKKKDKNISYYYTVGGYLAMVVN